MQQSFQINTLHRGKYMLCFFLLLFVAGGASSLIPTTEIAKVIIMLFTIPVILFLSVKFSQNPSTWILSEEQITVKFPTQTHSYTTEQIDHIRSLTRSGGNLYVIYIIKKSPARYWRNKLFQSNDDHDLLHQALVESPIDYFKM